MVDAVTEVEGLNRAVAKGEVSQRVVLENDSRAMRGEILDMGTIVNTMVDQLNAFASEVSRVAHEVGTEGKLGGQAQVPGVAGPWKDLTDNVNSMAASLTSQVRRIVEVLTAVGAREVKRKGRFLAQCDV